MTSMQKQQLREILNAEDVEGLLALGAPADEYDSEAERVAAALGGRAEGTLGEEHIVSILEKVWADSFGLSQEEIRKRVPGLRRIANRILENFIGPSHAD